MMMSQCSFQIIVLQYQVVISIKKMQGLINVFCYFQLEQLSQFIVECVITALSLLLVGDAFRKYIKMRGSHNRHVVFVYSLLFLWWLTFVLGSGFTFILYGIKDNQGMDTDTMSVLTKYLFGIDWVNAFLIQWLLLYLPYQWSKQISQLFDPAVQTKKSYVVQLGNQKYKGFETKIYKTLKYYIKFRFAYLVFPILFFIFHQEQELLFKLSIYTFLVDCLFITFSLLLGLISLKKTKQLKELLDEQQTRRTFNQYIVVIIASIIRFGFDLFNVIDQENSRKYFEPQCPYPSNHQILDIIFGSVATILTFYLPIFIVLRIYNLEDKPELICQSLIISQQNYENKDSLIEP